MDPTYQIPTTPNAYGGSPLRKYVSLAILAVVAAIVVFFIVWISSLLNKATITVSGSGKNTVVLVAGVSSNGKNAFQQQAENHLSVRVQPGTYTVSAQGHVATVAKTVTVKAGQNLVVNLSLPKVYSPEPVASVNAADIAVGSSQLLYINRGPSTLFSINSQNNVVASPTSTTFESIKWADSGFGIGQDFNGNLYILNGTNVAPLSTPSGSGSVSYAVSPAHQIYIAVGTAVYAQDSGNFKQIYTSQFVPVQLIASNNNLAMVSAPKKGVQHPVMAIITTSGKLVSSGAVDGVSGAWSPDGTKVAIIGFEDGTTIYNVSLKQVATLPNAGTGLAWLNNTTLFYSSANNVWAYSFSTKNSSLLASLPPGNSIGELSLDDNHAYVYLPVQDSTGDATLYRVGLKGQKVSDTAYEIGVFFSPSNTTQDQSTNEGCAISYANFTAPTLLVQANPNQSDSCQQLVATQLNEDGLDPNQVKVNYIPIGGD